MLGPFYEVRVVSEMGSCRVYKVELFNVQKTRKVASEILLPVKVKK